MYILPIYQKKEYWGLLWNKKKGEFCLFLKNSWLCHVVVIIIIIIIYFLICVPEVH